MRPRRAAAIAAAIVAAGLAPTAPRADDGPRGRFVTVVHTRLDEAPTRGPRDALVTVEVFFSAGSELGNQAYRRAMALWRKHPTRVRVVFRPLKRSDNSEVVAPIALAVHARGRFFEFMDDLIGQPGPQPSADAVLDAAVRAGLDRTTAAAANTNDAVLRVLAANERAAERARVGQRADLVVNGRAIGATPDEATLETAYRSALALARLERAAGASVAALPALSARRLRCLDTHERLISLRGLADDEAEAPGPVAGLHLGALLLDGTGCAAEPIPTGRPDQPEAPPQSGVLLPRPLRTTGLPSCGPSEAPVVVQVVCNLRNASCTDQLERVRKVAYLYYPSVRVVFRPWVDLDTTDASLQFPLAQAAMCSQRLGDGWRFVMAMRGVDRESVDLHAQADKAHVATDAFDACVDGPRDAARRTVEDARAAGVAWSPTVIVGQRAYVGGLTDARPLEDLIDAELAPGLLGGTSDAGLPIPPSTEPNSCDDSHDVPRVAN